MPISTPYPCHNDLRGSAPVVINGVRLEALRGAALWWPDKKILVVADMHFEKGSAFAARGVMLPPYDTAETIARLEALTHALRPSGIVALGDSFHDARAEWRMAGPDREKLRALTEATDFLWIEGNHDPSPPGFLLGDRASVATVGPLTFRHEPTAGPCLGEVAGHLHPCAVVSGAGGRRVRAKCFATDGERLVMPSFGAFTGGLNILDTAFDPVFAAGCDAMVIGTDRVYAVPGRRLCHDKPISSVRLAQP